MQDEQTDSTRINTGPGKHDRAGARDGAIQGATIALGQVTGVAYYTIEPEGYRVIATIAAGYGETPMRFEAVLTDGQKLLVSVPGTPGTTASKLEIARSGDRLMITDAPVLVTAAE